MNEKMKDKEIIVSQIKKYIEIIFTEYKDQIPDYIKYSLNNIDLNDVVKIEDTNTISLYVSSGKMYLPTNAYKIIEAMKRIPGFGINKTHVTHKENDIIINNNTFLDYIKHVFLKGLSPLEYFLEILLHETMHLCGADGNLGLKEGFTELKTRQLAAKYNLKTSACGYPKEVKIAYELESILGKDICDKITFMNNQEMIFQSIKNEIGRAEAYLYIEVLNEVQKNFQTYINKNFPGITGPIKKTFEYEKIDYGTVWEIFKKYYQDKELSDNNKK